MYYLLISCAAILILAMIIGFRRGLLRSLLHVISIILSFVAAYVLSPMVIDYINTQTEIPKTINSKIYTEVETGIQRSVADSLSEAGVNPNDIPKLTEEETRYIMTEGTDKNLQNEIIQKLSVPHFAKKLIEENNTEEVYAKLKVENFYDFVAGYFTKIAVNVIGTAATYLGVQLILLIICWIVGSVIRNVPVLAAIDKICGLVLGAVIGCVLVWIFLCIAQIALKDIYQNMVADNIILVWLDKTNLLAKLLVNIKW